MMKKRTYLMTLIFTAIVLMACSCEKDDPVVPEPQTLEEQYPEWVNLTWVSTDGADETYIYPRLNITIDGDDVTVNQPHSEPDPEENSYNGFYDEMTISGNYVDFGDGDVTGTFTSDDVHITLTTFGFMTTEHVYVLKIN